jgi:micrococcal nuclease
MTRWIAFLLVLALTSSALANQELRRVERVIDGDTIVLGGGETVRLIGVDTPETVNQGQEAEPFGREAAEYLRGRLAGGQVYLEYEPGDRTDTHERTVAYVYLPDGTLLNEAIIQAGYGRVYTASPFFRVQEFQEAERRARENGVGLWSVKERLGGDAMEVPDEPGPHDTAVEQIPVSDEASGMDPRLPGSRLVKETRAGLLMRRPDGSKALQETEEISAVVGAEFRWIVVLEDRKEPIEWREYILVPGGEWFESGEGVIATNQDRIEHGWTVEDGERLGTYRVKVELEGRQAASFRFELREPL